MTLRLSIKYILFRIGKYYHSMMPLFRQERCAPRAPIRCHADFTSRERQHRLAQHDNSSTLKGVFGSFWIAWFTTQGSVDESSINTNSSLRPRNANINCMFRECFTSQDFHISYHVIFVSYITWCFLLTATATCSHC